MKIACPNCGANVEFLPDIQKCYCEHCNSCIETKEFKTVLEETIKYAKQYCTSCGAKIIASNTSLISKCIYCGSNELLTKNLEKKYKPEGILPFMVTKESISKYYMNYAKENSFPEELMQPPELQEINGVYVPYMEFSWDVDLIVNRKHNVVTYKDYKDVGRQFDDTIMKYIHPFDVNNIIHFNPLYIVGFCADTLNQNVKKFQKQSLSEVQESFSYGDFCRKQMEKINRQNYYSQPINLDNISLYLFKIINYSEKLVLFPIYFFKKQTLNKIYHFAMNGRTGDIVCYECGRKKYKILFDSKTDKEINKYASFHLSCVPTNYDLKKIKDLKKKYDRDQIIEDAVITIVGFLIMFVIVGISFYVMAKK